MCRSWNKAWNNTPRIDCGLCGVSTCAAFARAIGAGILSLDICPILQLPEFADQKKKLDEYTKQKSRIKNAPDMPEGGILLTRPCKDTDEKVMAEMRVFNGVKARSPMYFSVFDPNTLCDLLECFSERFDLVKCSRDLGYARADVDDRSITILQDGRINMRRIANKEEVVSIFSEIERAILGSVICNCCGAELLSILTGFVKPNAGEHPVLNAGSTFHLDQSAINQPITKDRLLRFGNDNLSTIINAIDKLKANLRDDIDKVLSMQLELRADYSNINETRCKIVSFLSNKNYTQHETDLMKVLALLWVIENARKGVQELRKIIEASSLNHTEELLKFLSQAKNGRLATSDEINPKLVLGFAQASRINRAMQLLEQWSV